MKGFIEVEGNAIRVEDISVVRATQRLMLFDKILTEVCLKSGAVVSLDEHTSEDVIKMMEQASAKRTIVETPTTPEEQPPKSQCTATHDQHGVCIRLQNHSGSHQDGHGHSWGW